MDMEARKNRMSEGGMLTLHSTPWARQFREDLKAMAQFDDFEEVDAVAEGNLMEFFSKDVAERISALDATQLRVATWAASLPPARDTSEKHKKRVRTLKTCPRCAVL
eukprot:3178193-Lingulodinium_polyedra.AAC.1